MASFLPKATTYRGKLNGLMLSFFYKGINRRSVIINSILFDKKKITIGKGCFLYGCRIRVCNKSKYIKVGDYTRVENNAFLNAHQGYIEIGIRSFIGPNTIIQGRGGVDIGDNVLIAGNCFISSSNHVYENVPKERFLLDEIGKHTVIKSNTWIGSNVTVVAGVQIGEGCVIGAGSVVTKDIPDFSVAVGAPAKIIKSTKYSSSE
jgi:carbonic anhydrase/acetyltransferase-like protein (isoleucine patch superfamily)